VLSVVGAAVPVVRENDRVDEFLVSEFVYVDLLIVSARKGLDAFTAEENVDIAFRIRQLREYRKLSQGDLEERTGLLRCYISRVENGHTVPSIETLQKISRALELSMYQLFFTEETSNPQVSDERSTKGHQDWASFGKGKRMLGKLRSALAEMSSRDRAMLLFVAMKMVAKKQKRKNVAD
jgi:transcriptional regulator with XRE-family HTH domain